MTCIHGTNKVMLISQLRDVRKRYPLYRPRKTPLDLVKNNLNIE